MELLAVGYTNLQETSQLPLLIINRQMLDPVKLLECMNVRFFKERPQKASVTSEAANDGSVSLIKMNP